MYSSTGARVGLGFIRPCLFSLRLEDKHDETIIPFQKKGRQVLGRPLHMNSRTGQDHLGKTKVTLHIRYHCRKYVEDNGIGL